MSLLEEAVCRFASHALDSEAPPINLNVNFEANTEDYYREEQRVIRYLLVETSRLRRTLPVDDAELRAYYDQHIDEFLEGEQARARHILFRLAPDANEVTRGEVELRANGVASIARSGGDFAALAAEHSEDPGSKEMGGDLGWFGRGQMVPEFEDVVFSAKPGDIVGPIKSQFGYHIIKVEGFRPEHQQPFEEVQEQVRFRVLEDRAVGEAEARAGVLARRLKAENPVTQDQWQSVADEDEAVVLNQSPPFSAGEAVAGASDGPELADAAFGSSVGEITGPVAVPRGWIVWQLAEVREAGIPPLENVREEVEQKLRRERAVELATDQGRQLAERWRGGEDGSTLAAEYGSNVTEARQHRRGQVVGALGVMPGLDNAVFSAKADAVIGPIKAGVAGGVVVAKINTLDLVDPIELANSRDDLRARLMTERGAQLMRSIIIERRRDTVVTVDNEFLQRFAPTSS